jgi:hypothetical protein
VTSLSTTGLCAWRDDGICALMGGHNGGRPRALSEAMVAMYRLRLFGHAFAAQAASFISRS